MTLMPVAMRQIRTADEGVFGTEDGGVVPMKGCAAPGDASDLSGGPVE
ncbi:hypothetical protein ACFXJ8_20475 [Nonomuraea sp. NPDC059194]